MELRQLTPRGTPHNIALTQHYLTFSEQEAKAYDWVDSSYFAEKGLMAGYGKSVLPEDVLQWNIPETLKPELITARDALIKHTHEQNRQRFSALTAKAVYHFDRWVEELDEGWDNQAISSAQEAFYQALEALKFAELEAEEAKKPTLRIENTAYLVYFGYNHTQFNEASKQVVDQVIADVKQSQPEQILIHGHTDSSGSDSYNMRLSEKRALKVLEALIAGGIPKKILSYFGFGETDPAVNRGDGVREPKNRRVEIFMG